MPEEIINNILNDPNFKETLLNREDYQNAVTSYRAAKSLKTGTHEYERVPEVMYKIIRYGLKKGSIRNGTNFWNDIIALTITYGENWERDEIEGQMMIDEIRNRTIPNAHEQAIRESPVYRLITGLCESRLQHLSVEHNENSLIAMVSFVLSMFYEDESLLEKIEFPGTIRGYIKSIIDTNFLKERYAKITEAFHHPQNDRSGYAHLSLRINKSKLEEHFGKAWYSTAIRDTFRTSVENRYHPYDNNPQYVDIAENNREIANKIKELFESLKQKKRLRSFPASDPRVSYNLQYANSIIIEVRYKDGLQNLGFEDTIEAEIVELDDDNQGGPAKFEDPDNMEVRDEPINPDAGADEQPDAIRYFDMALNNIIVNNGPRAEDPERKRRRYKAVIILNDIKEMTGEEVGVWLFQHKLTPDGHNIDNPEGRIALARYVNHENGNAKAALCMTFNQIIRNAKYPLDEEDLNSIREHIRELRDRAMEEFQF